MNKISTSSPIELRPGDLVKLKPRDGRRMKRDKLHLWSPEGRPTGEVYYTDLCIVIRLDSDRNVKELESVCVLTSRGAVGLTWHNHLQVIAYEDKKQNL